MGEIGEVVDINGDILKVKFKRSEACAKCRVCTAGMASEDMLLDAVNLCGAKVGEMVHIEIDGDNFLKAVFIMYGIPFVFLITGFVIGYYGSLYIGVSHNEIIGFVSGILLVLLSFLLIRKKESYWKSKNFSPKAVKIER